ncbi:MAG: FHA domain-containing protein, partial [Planctomycetota bacterium]
MPIDTSQTAGLVVARGGEYRTVPLEPRGVVLGRAASCEVLLESPHVSRKHARLWQDPFGRWVIEDLGSRNG